MNRVRHDPAWIVGKQEVIQFLPVCPSLWLNDSSALSVPYFTVWEIQLTSPLYQLEFANRCDAWAIYTEI